MPVQVKQYDFSTLPSLPFLSVLNMIFLMIACTHACQVTAIKRKRKAYSCCHHLPSRYPLVVNHFWIAANTFHQEVTIAPLLKEILTALFNLTTYFNYHLTRQSRCLCACQPTHICNLPKPVQVQPSQSKSQYQMYGWVFTYGTLRFQQSLRNSSVSVFHAHSLNHPVYYNMEGWHGNTKHSSLLILQLLGARTSVAFVCMLSGWVQNKCFYTEQQPVWLSTGSISWMKSQTSLKASVVW